MSKKYDNNLNEIKDTIPIKTFATNTTDELDKKNGITTSITQTLITQFYNKTEQFMTDSLLKDMQENKEKYKGLMIMPIEREKIVELLNKGKEFDQLKQQLAEKDEEITMLKSQNQFFMEEIKRLDQLSNLKDREIETLKFTIDGMCNANKNIRNLFEAFEEQTRHQICEEAKKRIVKETCYDTEEEVRNATYDFNAKEVLEILDQLEKGE